MSKRRGRYKRLSISLDAERLRVSLDAYKNCPACPVVQGVSGGCLNVELPVSENTQITSQLFVSLGPTTSQPSSTSLDVLYLPLNFNFYSLTLMLDLSIHPGYIAPNKLSCITFLWTLNCPGKLKTMQSYLAILRASKLLFFYIIPLSFIRARAYLSGNQTGRKGELHKQFGTSGTGRIPHCIWFAAVVRVCVRVWMCSHKLVFLQNMFVRLCNLRRHLAWFETYPLTSFYPSTCLFSSIPPSIPVRSSTNRFPFPLNSVLCIYFDWCIWAEFL